MTRPAVAIIDLEAYKANYALAKKRAGEALCVAVIKANGYGHGMCQLAKALPDAPLAVACVDEAMQLRREGVDNPLLVLEGAFSLDELRLASEYDLQLAVHADYQIDQLAELTGYESPVDVWLKINIGMNRLGFTPAAAVNALYKLNQLSSSRLVGVMTHFSCADEQDETVMRRQLVAFNRVIESAKAITSGLLVCAANSATLLAHQDAIFDAVRPGIMLYGSSPFEHCSADSLGIRSVMTLTSRIMAIHDVEAGDCVGYAGTWQASRATRIATVAIGYGDGYPRHAGTGTPVWVGDRVVPLIGRVSMDMLSVDLTYHPDAKIGDEVELWGKNISIDEVAKSAGTISYELLTGVTSRVPRQYLTD